MFRLIAHYCLRRPTYWDLPTPQAAIQYAVAAPPNAGVRIDRSEARNEPSHNPLNLRRENAVNDVITRPFAANLTPRSHRMIGTELSSSCEHV